uniref:Ig-like domain-containing protein n=1 Tax=Poecilia latipinna TaxID=48699 RepID=A0A3B3U9K8_9TELE
MRVSEIGVNDQYLFISTLCPGKLIHHITKAQITQKLLYLVFMWCRICPDNYWGVKWYLDETLLYTNELNEIQVTPGGFHTLTFRQLARKDTGTISFVAGDKRSYSEIISPFVFMLPERRPTIIKSLEDCEAFEGGGLVLSCVTSKPCHILWYKDGCLMWHSSRYFTTHSGCEARLTIREVSNSDAGVYECSAGSVTTTAVVTVKGMNIKCATYSVLETIAILQRLLVNIYLFIYLFILPFSHSCDLQAKAEEPASGRRTQHHTAV